MSMKMSASGQESNHGLAAEIVTTGTELLLGEIVDTNAAWMAQQLRESGVNLYYKTTVGDNEARLRGVLELALSRSDVVIVSGGLGPTADDITRQAIAAATQRPLLLSEQALTALRARFARFGVEMTDNNRQQALIPEGAMMIENPVGTAPGFIVESDHGTIIAVPGVPREMMRLMTDTVLPYLRDRSGHAGIIRRRVLRTVGIGESTLDSKLGALMLEANPTVGLAAHTAQTDIRITARAATAEEAEALIDRMAARVEAVAGEYVYSTEAGRPIEAVIDHMLAHAQRSLALLESNTLGAVAHRLSESAGDDGPALVTWTAGGPDLPASLAASANQGLGAPSEGAAVQCAQAARVAAGTDLGLAILGTSGNDEGVYGQAEGVTWIALANDAGAQSLRVPYGGADEATVARISNQALSLLWRHLKQAS